MEIQAEAGVGVQLQASLDQVAAELRKQRQRQQWLAQAIHYVNLPGVPMAISSSTGSLNQPNLFGPMTGKVWDVKRITASGFTAGIVNVFLNSTSGDQVAAFTTAGSLFFGKGHLLISQNDSLVFNATGVTSSTNTISVQIAVVEVDLTCQGDYLL